MKLYDISVKTRDNLDVKLEKYKGKVLLIVNTATGCGLTPQYKEIEELYEKYHEQGLEVLDFPCNQFGHQAPGDDNQIHEFCTLQYKTQFDQFKKIDVNGENQSDLFKYLKEQQGFKGFKGLASKILIPVVSRNDKNWKTSSDIKWNFTKFLVDREGNVIERFEPMIKPRKIESKIKELL